MALSDDLLRVQPQVLPHPGPGMLSADIFRRFGEACRRDAEAWSRVETLADWERFRQERIDALRDSLGPLPTASGGPRVELTGELSGAGHRVRKLVYQAAPGQPVPAHLYLPEKAGPGMPGILICHSHHQPKDQGELQDMGVSWARSGAAVLIPDMPGHGERRDQEFGGRQDYYTRYYSGMQLHLIGESLMGWMVRDLLGGVDLLLDTDGVTPEKIVLVGAVAGGGDPVAVAAALDERVKCSVPFNFGKGERWRKSMPAERGDRLNFCGSGSWEGTRNLPLSARDGFLPWVIVAACAPRPLIYAHEFEWVPETDPVWDRLKEVYALYRAEENLSTVRGRGGVTGLGGPENTHCTNVGPIHREQMYPAWEKWFGLRVEEHQERREGGELLCLTPEVRAKFAPKKIHAIAAETGRKLSGEATAVLAGARGEDRLRRLRTAWAGLLGDVEPGGRIGAESLGEERLAGAQVEKLVLRTGPEVKVPALLLLPESGGKRPAVACICQEGKDRFLRERAVEVAALLAGGAAVCVADLRGTGETCPDAEWGREGEANTVSAEELMLGGTLAGSRLRDLRALLGWLGARPEIDGSRLGLWGTSLAGINPADFGPAPQEGDGIDVRNSRDWLAGREKPCLAEPMGPLVALLGALFEPGVRAVLAEGGLVSFASMLEAVEAHVPHEAHVPGALAVGDLPLLAESLSCAVRRGRQIDGLNRLDADGGDDAGDPAAWLLENLG